MCNETSQLYLSRVLESRFGLNSVRVLFEPRRGRRDGPAASHTTTGCLLSMCIKEDGAGRTVPRYTHVNLIVCESSPKGLARHPRPALTHNIILCCHPGKRHRALSFRDLLVLECIGDTLCPPSNPLRQPQYVCAIKIGVTPQYPLQYNQFTKTEARCQPTRLLMFIYS